MLRREFKITPDDFDSYTRLVCRIDSTGQAEICMIYNHSREERWVSLDAEEVKRLRAALAKIDDPKTWEGNDGA